MTKFNDVEELEKHFAKVDKLVKYYMEHMETEHDTIQEALEYLFADLDTNDLNRAMDELKLKNRY